MGFPRSDWPHLDEARAAAMRAALVDPASIKALGPRRARLSEATIPALYAFVRDPAVSDPIYVIPKPVTLSGVARWAHEMLAAQARGDGVTVLHFDEDGMMAGFTEFLVWPDYGAGEIGGAIRADLQGGGEGAAGFAQAVAWLFEIIGLDRIALTAGIDNLRSQAMIDRAGFVRQGELDSRRPGGTVRRSIWWELTRDQWARRVAR